MIFEHLNPMGVGLAVVSWGVVHGVVAGIGSVLDTVSKKGCFCTWKLCGPEGLSTVVAVSTKWGSISWVSL